MMTLDIFKGSFYSQILAPPSKSYANRALILASLMDCPIEIQNLPSATDVTIMIAALKKIGLEMIEGQNSIKVLNSFPTCEKTGQVIEIGEGGTTARFLACLLLLGRKEYKLILGKRLKLRPWDDFISIAKSLDAKVSLEDNVLSIQGPGQFPAVLNVDCSKTTQFATGFNLLSTVTGSEIVVSHFHSSQSYLHMTLKMVEEMKMMSVFAIPGDWSSASYALAFSALNQPLFIEGLAQDLYQSDSKLFGILKELNCLEETSSGLVIKPTVVSKSFDLDVSDCLDLVPTLGYLFSHIEGIHHLRNVQNLIYKESDRLSEVMKLILKFNRKTYLRGNDLIIEGSHQIMTERVDLTFPDDHRLVMTGALFLMHHQGGTLVPAESVKKSYPDFFKTISEGSVVFRE